MKDRATVFCRRGDRILLVARSQQPRWTLPGGMAKRGESLYEAARRELAEETGLVFAGAQHLFAVEGAHKRHHVFLATLDAQAVAQPAGEIAHCAWIDRQTLGSMKCSRPTWAIVELAFAWMELDDAREAPVHAA
ncbi:NUDIX hydrolase [Paraburkholderia sp. J12]|uniref:NUDIX hydrolase n=1 Tax=Paraburkholderia sp. J12 TaxID=2805432 RepID=UPI002ABE2FA0|nr:NUDIX domain-containing protein [Paraburkholderia sp. J12]